MNSENFKFKLENPLHKRVENSKLLRCKYPDKLPIICEVGNIDKKSDLELNKNKFLVPKNITLGQFSYIIKQRTNLKSEEAIYIFVNNTLPPNSMLMSNIYSIYKDNDNFLYLTIFKEQTFG